MAIYAVFGQNGVGKDSVLAQVTKLNSHILTIKSTKIFMMAMGYPVDIFSTEEPPIKWYIALEQASSQEIDRLSSFFGQYLKRFAKQKENVLATFHLVLLKKDRNGRTFIYKEKMRSWYSELFKGAIYLKADLRSIWTRRQKDLLLHKTNRFNGKDRGDFSKADILLQSEASNQVWDVLVREYFMDQIPYLVLDNSDSSLGKNKKIDIVARKILRFIN